MYSPLENIRIIENAQSLLRPTHPADKQKVLLTHCGTHVMRTEQAIVRTARRQNRHQMGVDVAEQIGQQPDALQRLALQQPVDQLEAGRHADVHVPAGAEFHVREAIGARLEEVDQRPDEAALGIVHFVNGFRLRKSSELFILNKLF